MPENFENKDRYMDELLDAGLQRLAQTEPLTGFEERVLAGLKGRELETDRRMWWFWGAAVAAAMAVTMFVMVSRQQPVQQAPVETAKTAPVQEITKPAPVAPPVTAKVASHPVVHVAASHVEQAPTVAQLVKRDVFPSPTGITAEERMLMAYLKHTPFEELAANSKPDEPFVVPKGDSTEMNLVLPGDASKSAGVNTK